MAWLWNSEVQEILSRLVRIEAGVKDLRKQQEQNTMSQADINRLREAVERNTGIIQSAITAFTGLAQQIRDAQDDPAELKALADQIDQNATKLAEAVAANSLPSNGDGDTSFSTDVGGTR